MINIKQNQKFSFKCCVMQRDTAACNQIEFPCSTREEKEIAPGRTWLSIPKTCYSIPQTVIFPFEKKSRFMWILSHSLIIAFVKMIKPIKSCCSVAGPSERRMGKERLQCIVSTSGQTMTMMMTWNAKNVGLRTGGKLLQQQRQKLSSIV